MTSSQQSEHEAPRPLGTLARLSKNRFVFLGRDAAYPGTWFLGFRNKEGATTKITLSDEAMTALIDAYNYPADPPRALPSRKNKAPIKMVWRAVWEPVTEQGTQETAPP